MYQLTDLMEVIYNQQYTSYLIVIKVRFVAKISGRSTKSKQTNIMYSPSAMQCTVNLPNTYILFKNLLLKLTIKPLGFRVRINVS